MANAHDQGGDTSARSSRRVSSTGRGGPPWRRGRPLGLSAAWFALCGPFPSADDSVAIARLGKIIPGCVMLCTTVVPERDGVLLPAESSLELDAVGDVVEEEPQKGIALSL